MEVGWNTTETIKLILWIISIIFTGLSFLNIFKPYFSLIGCVATRKFPEAKKQHRYAIMVAARNEAAVIGNLIESIRAQDYPQELVDIFVVADNCTDDTADIVRDHGAVCYERFDQKHCTKGYALQFLVERIRRDFGLETYDGFFIFDADNLLKKDYITRMNESFDAGEKIITSYRNTKNFNDNWIAASYGIHWLRSARFEHRPRSLLRMAARIQGTGFLFATELIKDGWKYTGFTEDRAFSADAVAMGYRISYNNRAEFFDEQPVDLKIALRQRIRWAKGHLQAVAETGPKLFAHIFVTKGVAGHYEGQQVSRGRRMLDNFLLRFSSFDMFSVVFPNGLLWFLRKFVDYFLKSILLIMSLDYFSDQLAPSLLRQIFSFLDVTVTADRLSTALVLLTLFTLFNVLVNWLEQVGMAICVFFFERKRIVKIKWYKKLWYCLTFPLFELIGNISSCIALVSHVEWKPIPHTSSVTIEEIEETSK